jgi:hypothetical protein
MKLLTVAAVVVSLLLAAAPAAADTLPIPSLPTCTPQASGNGAATCTLHLTDMAVPMTLPAAPDCAFPGGIAVWTVNAVVHIRITPAGDTRITGTLTGPFVISDATGVVLYTGQATATVRSDSLAPGSADHATLNVEAVNAATNATATFHAIFQMATNANGEPTATVTKTVVSC